MKLAPGTPLQIGLWLDEASPAEPVGRLAMGSGRAVLEWSPQMVAGKRPIAPALYPTEPGLHEARTRDFDGLHGFLADSLPEGWGALLMKRRLAKLDVRWDDLDGVTVWRWSAGRGAAPWSMSPLPHRPRMWRHSTSMRWRRRRARSCWGTRRGWLTRWRHSRGLRVALDRRSMSVFRRKETFTSPKARLPPGSRAGSSSFGR